MKRSNILFLLLLALSVSHCKKYLEAKPDKKLAIPSTVEDLQALLDNADKLNQMTPSADEASADDYYLNQSTYNALIVPSQQVYIWENPPSLIFGDDDWARIYNSVYTPNVCLDALPAVARTAENGVAWDNVKGSALFFRALGFFRAAVIFASAWDATTADTDDGIVLRLTSDFNEPSVRATLRQTYDQILSDLRTAAPLLPVTPRHVNRPSRTAAYGLLARVFLSMRAYDSCYKYASSCLELKDDLLDYRNPADVNIDNVFAPFTQFNKEVIFSSTLGTYTYEAVYPGYARVDSAFYDSYHVDDLRRYAYFTDLFGDGYSFQGTYDGTFSALFLGLAVDEIYLMRAETHARAGRIGQAMADLNHLLLHRFREGSFTPLEAGTPAEALQLVLAERRKELLFRGLRWMDIKRLNREGAGITLTRRINGQTYTLPPNDKRYALLIPEDIIRLTQIPQNPR
ncbi:MAG: RagB/SusD family nutrient uptake outer membrane protein [Agriterribacter sp.]